MYDIIKSVITDGGYNLTDMLKKIDTIWIQGDITDDQRKELVEMAQANADPDNSLAPLQRQIDALFTNMGELAETIKSLSGRVTVLEGQEPTPEPEPEEYPAWEPWGGVGPIPWQTGSKCSHKDKRWVSQVDNNIWEPGAEGVHETIWKEAK